MNRKTIGALAIAVLLGANVSAQSLNDGLKALNSGKYKEAEGIFQKLGNSGESAYWLFRTYFDEDDVNKAKTYLNSIAAANANDPYIMAARGEMALVEGKAAEGNQLIQSAITAATGRKGIDPAIANAIGRAINNAYDEVKAGDLNAGIAMLKSAVATKPKDTWLLANLWTELGEMQLHANPGEGSEGFQSFQNASLANSGFARAYMKQAMIFKSQRNYPLYMEYLTKATNANPTYMPAWYEQYYYWLGTNDYTSALKIAEQIKSALPAGDLNSEYINASTLYLNKQYDQAIQSANALITKAGAEANPDAYKVIAWSYIDKKDTAAAIPFVDKYFEKVKKSEVDAKDYTLKAMAYSARPGSENVIFQTFIDAAANAKEISDKIDVLEEGAKFFEARQRYDYRGDMLSKIIETKPADKLTMNDYWYMANAYLRAGSVPDPATRASFYEKSWKALDIMRSKYNSAYGYLMAHRTSKFFDSLNVKGIAVPDAVKLIDFSKTDTAAEAKNNLYSAAYWLGIYYFNEKKDKDSSLKYLRVSVDNAPSDDVKTQLEDVIKTVSQYNNGGNGNKGTTPPPGSTSKNTQGSQKPKGGK